MAIKYQFDLLKPTVIYDGDCKFCIKQIERFRQLDQNNVFEYLPRLSPEAGQRFPILETIDFEQGMCLIGADNKNYRGADAVYQILKCLPATRWFAWLYCLPGINHLSKASYAWIAANRKKLGKTCNNGSCKSQHDS